MIAIDINLLWMQRVLIYLAGCATIWLIYRWIDRGIDKRKGQHEAD